MVELDTLAMASALVPNMLLFTALDEIYEGRYWLVMSEKHIDDFDTASFGVCPNGPRPGLPSNHEGYMNDGFIFLISPAFN